MGIAATLHDVGKIAIPDQLLLKREPLTDQERRAMQRHALIGHEMLAGSDDPLLEMAAANRFGPPRASGRDGLSVRPLRRRDSRGGECGGGGRRVRRAYQHPLAP